MADFQDKMEYLAIGGSWTDIRPRIRGVPSNRTILNLHRPCPRPLVNELSILGLMMVKRYIEIDAMSPYFDEININLLQLKSIIMDAWHAESVPEDLRTAIRIMKSYYPVYHQKQ